MESLRLSLRARRKLRHDLVHFLDAVALYLQAGYDLGYAWPEALAALGPALDETSRRALAPAGGEAVGSCLARLGGTYPDPAHRLWFGVVAELHAEGAPVLDAVRAASGALRREHELDLDAHCRTLPTKANLVLVAFYFPAAAALLILPLLLEILQAFPG